MIYHIHFVFVLENGDRMSIQGMNGTKKIKAIFIEAKVPKRKKRMAGRL